MTPLNLAAMSAKLAFGELQMVRAFRAGAQLQLAQEELKLAERRLESDDDPQYADFLADQYTIAQEIHELSEELAVVAAYRVLELNVKREARWLDKAYTHFAWPSFTKLLASKTGIALNSLNGSDAINELRLLNNAIKHEGKVTEDLAKYSSWVIGERVHPLDAAFERLSPAIPPFIEALARAVLPEKLGGNRPNEDVFPPKPTSSSAPPNEEL